jgi:hypothetical protein
MYPRVTASYATQTPLPASNVGMQEEVEHSNCDTTFGDCVSSPSTSPVACAWMGTKALLTQPPDSHAEAHGSSLLKRAHRNKGTCAPPQVAAVQTLPLASPAPCQPSAPRLPAKAAAFCQGAARSDFLRQPCIKGLYPQVLPWSSEACSHTCSGSLPPVSTSNAESGHMQKLGRNAVVSEARAQGRLVEQVYVADVTNCELLATTDAPYCVQRRTAILVVNVLLAAAVGLVVVIQATLDDVERRALNQSAHGIIRATFSLLTTAKNPFETHTRLGRMCPESVHVSFAPSATRLHASTPALQPGTMHQHGTRPHNDGLSHTYHKQVSRGAHVTRHICGSKHLEDAFRHAEVLFQFSVHPEAAVPFLCCPNLISQVLHWALHRDAEAVELKHAKQRGCKVDGKKGGETRVK